jgi:aspartyl-tRNA(Asn)/glutamyl-tRNA(Gln) amidotransferase subunit A
MSDLLDLSLAELGEELRGGRVSSSELVSLTFDRISRLDPVLHAFIALTKERALEEARSADVELRAGRDRGPMHGVPYAVKDMIDVEGLPTTCNSRASESRPAQRDAAVVARLRLAGAVLVGKLGLAEFGTGGSGRFSPFPKPRNPWDLGREPGNSSSGAAVAVAAGMVRVSIGTDTGGSLRQPAAYCGVVGLKPTAGRVSTVGLHPVAPSLDHCGPMGRCVRDVAIAMQAIGEGGRPTGPRMGAPDFVDGLEDGVAGLRVGLPKDHWGFGGDLDPRLEAAMDHACAVLRDGGAEIVEFDPPAFEGFRAAGMTIMLGEAFAGHRERLAARLEDYAPETAERFLVGAAVTAEDLARARRVAAALGRQFDGSFEGLDVVMTPTVVSAAPRLDQAGDVRANPNRMPALPFNLTGHPALSLPVALDAEGLPLAVQLVARRWDEARLLRCAWRLERDSGWRDARLPIDRLRSVS